MSWMPEIAGRNPGKMHLFYTPFTDPESLTLDEEETRHCTRVLRLVQGDRVYVTDGKGSMFECRIREITGKKCQLEMVSEQKDYHKRNSRIHIAIAPTKSIDRFEWFLEKSTEIGIDEITPLFCKHSERTHLKTDRLQKVIISAMKQSLKAYLPLLHPPVNFGKFRGSSFDGQKFIAFCDADSTLELHKIYNKGSNALILIGPEGDFSEEEIDLAKKDGFIPITLGKSRLRTETAGVVACTIINFLNQ